MRKISIILWAVLLVSLPVFAATIHVPGQYPTIQAGINAASDGDTVLVADGTYTGTGNKDLDFGGRAIVVKSENGAGSCIIDCENDGRGFYFHSDEDSTSVLSGFKIINGYAAGSCYPFAYGGGIFCEDSSPTITHCVLMNNLADSLGGGICCYYSSPKIEYCTVHRNCADAGGSMFFRSGAPEIKGCIISYNYTICG